jgi:hypothetical protein
MGQKYLEKKSKSIGHSKSHPEELAKRNELLT